MAVTTSLARPQANRLVRRGAAAFLFLLAAVLVPVASASAESTVVPPLPVEVPAVSATVNEAAGVVTGAAQPAVEAVTPQDSSAGSGSRQGSGNSSGGDGSASSADPVGSVSGAAENAAGEAIRNVSGAAGDTEGAPSAPASSSSPSPTPTAALPAATVGGHASAPAHSDGGQRASSHGRRAAPGIGDARLLQPIGSLARSLGPLVEDVGTGLSLSALRAGVGNLEDLLPSTLTVRGPRPAPQSVSAPASSTSPAIFDPSQPQSWLLFLCVVAAGALAIVYLLAHELGTRPFVALRRRF